MNQQKKRSYLAPERNGGQARQAPFGASQVRSSDADPPESWSLTWDTATRLALISIAFVVLIFALYVARSILMPVMAALIIGITLRPIQVRLAEYRIPRFLTALVLIGTFLGAASYLVTLVAASLTEWVGQISDIGNVIREKLRWLDQPLAALRELQKAIAGTTGDTAPKVAVETSLATMLQGVVVIITPAISELVLFIGTLLFFMVGTERLRRQLITLFDTRDARLTVVRIWSDIEQNLVSYLGTVTLINAGLAAATTAMLYLVGFPNPLAFGALCFVLNFAPYIGPALVVIALTGVGLIAYPTLGGALLPPALFLVFQVIEGEIVTPSVIGHRLTLSPFLVFLALAFWTWLWGPLGTFMATPLLIVGLVLLGHLFRRDEVTLPK
jgi:predicted PurR-regulated permease PerM